MAYSKKQQFIGLIVWLVICFSASAVGAIASMQARSFYGQLVQPNWAPPGWLFGPVWTVLFVLMAIAAWLVWRSAGLRSQPIALPLFLVQLVFNALWSWLFFAWHLGAMALVNIVILWLLIAATMVFFFRVNLIAASLLIPYLLWVSFAAALNYSVWQLNPYILS